MATTPAATTYATNRPRRLRNRRRGGRGSASAEMVIATPLLLLLILAIVQFALWWHAAHIAATAATHALAATRSLDGTAAAGHAEAGRMLDDLAGEGLIQGATIQVTRSTTTATASVRISGECQQVVPLVDLPVRAEATGPLERFTTNGDQFAGATP